MCRQYRDVLLDTGRLAAFLDEALLLLHDSDRARVIGASSARPERSCARRAAHEPLPFGAVADPAEVLARVREGWPDLTTAVLPKSRGEWSRFRFAAFDHSLQGGRHYNWEVRLPLR